MLAYHNWLSDTQVITVVGVGSVVACSGGVIKFSLLFVVFLHLILVGRELKPSFLQPGVKWHALKALKLIREI